LFFSPLLGKNAKLFFEFPHTPTPSRQKKNLKELQNNFLVSDHEIDHTAPHPTTNTITLK
jgi:hypothetical protein